MGAASGPQAIIFNVGIIGVPLHALRQSCAGICLNILDFAINSTAMNNNAAASDWRICNEANPALPEFSRSIALRSRTNSS